MYDLTRSYFNDLREWPVAANILVIEEGQFLNFVDDGAGGTAVRPSTGVAPAAGERPAGFAITDALKYVTDVVVERVTVPLAGPFTVQLPNSNITALTDVRAYNVTGAVALTVVGVAPAAGEVQVAIATGLLTFNAAEAGDTVDVYYRYTMSFQEVLAKYHERSINNRAQDYFSSVSVGCLNGVIFTSMYATAQTYAVNDLVRAGAGGLLTNAAIAGVPDVGHVIQVPGLTDALLGVSFLIPQVG